jgi:hypothetical protein
MSKLTDKVICKLEMLDEATVPNYATQIKRGHKIKWDKKTYEVIGINREKMNGQNAVSFHLKHKSGSTHFTPALDTLHHMDRIVEQSEIDEKNDLAESNVPKVHGFDEFKRHAEDWAMNNTHHGKTNIKKHDAVLPNGKILRQTLSLGHANNGQSYIIGVFNHESKDSEKGHGWHHARGQGVNEEALDEGLWVDKKKAWMATFENNVVSKDSKHQGKIDWDTAQYLHKQGHTPASASEQYLKAKGPKTRGVTFESFSDTVKKVGKNLAARPNKGAMPAAGRTKKMTEEDQLDEGRMKELAMDLEGPDSLHDTEFVKKYGKSKQEWHGILGTKPKKLRTTAKSNVREPRQEFPTEEVNLDEAAPKLDPNEVDEFEAGRKYQDHSNSAAFYQNTQGWTGKFNDIYNRDWKKELAYHKRHAAAYKKVLDYHKTRKEEATADYPTLDEEAELMEGPSLADMHPDNINAIIRKHGKRHMVATGPGEPMQHGFGFKDLKAKLGIGTSASVHKKFVSHLKKNGFKSSWSHTSNEWVAHPK